MSNFENYLLSNVDVSIRTYDDVHYSEKTLVKHFKDWRQPKPLVEVPKFVADWIEFCKDDGFSLSYMMSCGGECFNRDVHHWMHSGVRNDELLAHAWFEGYTVKEEKKYVLKHIDMSKFSKGDSLYLHRSIKEDLFGKYDHRRLPDDADMSNVIDCHFTQSEIDSLHIGSYEQIEVEP